VMTTSNPFSPRGIVKDRTMKKRQRPSSISPASNIFLLLMLMAWSHHHCVEGFIPPQGRSSIVRWSRVAAGSNHNSHDETPLNSRLNSFVGGRRRKESRLQVRRRVKAVLEKARVRTGVRNGSVPSSPPPPPRSTPTVVAEAASIGGLGDGSADIVFSKKEQTSRSSSALTSDDEATISRTNVTSAGSRNEPFKNTLSQSINNTNVMYFEDEQLDLEKSNREVNGQVNVTTANGAKLEASASAETSKTNGYSDSMKNGNAISSNTATDTRSRKPKEFDVIRGDVPSANAIVEPLPFTLPNLSSEQKMKLAKGERVQEQSRMGREGSGYVVLDVDAPPYVIWECLLDFESYSELIPTVKSMQLYTSTKLNTGFTSEKPVLPGTGRETRHYGTPSITRASFVLSKFRFNIAAIHRYTPHPQGDYMVFTLDPSCTNMVLKGAKGTWYTEENPDGKEGFTRVYLLAGLQISRALPKFIVDYAAERAMPRATKWLRPEVEALKEELFGEGTP
jgi:hypothetical protein